MDNLTGSGENIEVQGEDQSNDVLGENERLESSKGASASSSP